MLTPTLIPSHNGKRVIFNPALDDPKNKNSVVSLHDIGVDADVRFVRYMEGIRFSDIDVAMAVTGKNNMQASIMIGRLSVNVKEEIYLKSITHKFKGRGQQLNKLVTIEGAFKLIMALPGKTALAMRLKVIDGMTQKLKELGEFEFVHNLFDETLAIPTQSQSELPTTKYIYATESEAFPGLLKIGRTKDISQRIQNLKTATAPKPHKLVAMTPTLHSKRDEKRAHEFFQDKRVAGEFFKVTAMEVMTFFHAHIVPMYNQEMEACEALPDYEESDSDSDEAGMSSLLGKRSAPEPDID